MESKKTTTKSTSAKKETQRKKVLVIPAEVEVLTKLTEDLVIANVPYKLMLEQDINAHIMTAETFKQLTNNIKKRKTLESLPLLALTERGIEIVSGHHRTRAGRDAGLEKIPCILDVSGLSRSAIAAKQLAHNAINGTDDMDMLKEIALLITEADDLIESYVGQSVIDEVVQKVDKSIAPKLNFEWKDINLMFLPHQFEDLKEFVDSVNTNVDYLGVASIEQFESFIDALVKYQTFSNIKNVGAAIHKLIEIALDKSEERAENSNWVPSSVIVGNGAVPKVDADKIVNAMKKVKDKYEINDKLGCLVKIVDLFLESKE